ncbi:(2Fe-2S)-binding protein [Pseudonocardia oroxyli]|uniref:Carbon-monoxide dehydrogenase small subunit n=1 Tax=Pseudonocardia oroxyli TaxID=366584 RepID=A0A1G8D9B7_PSEOR|nr:(2Fe-2S)-binding protein [Pseudonocardia oroxyli]SDH54134.1 carbon-monoxide dehydrogenase small subunit [Pseudonocardia oroxyli]
MNEHRIEIVVNGRKRTASVEPRKVLADVLREDCELTGTHLGCEHGVCGACTVLVDGDAVRSCLMFGVQADGAEVTTIEGVAPGGGELSDVQAAFRDCHGLQCGFCTPGFVITVRAFLAENPRPTDAEIRSALSGNLCRCTGYQGIIAAVRQVVRQRTGLPPGAEPPASDIRPPSVPVAP